jgi:uncharacterized membrane protein
MIAETVGAPSRAPGKLRPFQAFTFLGLSIVVLMTLAALGNAAIGRSQLAEKFSNLATLVHFILVFSAIPLALVQIALPKGTLPHRAVGYTWCALMIVAAIVSFWMHEITGGFSPPHAFSILTLIMIPLIVLFARTGWTRSHRNTVLWLNLIVIIAGLLAFTAPGERALATMLWGVGN